MHAFDQPPAGPYCLAVVSCTTLISLDVGFCSLSSEMWHSLPPGLKELRCSLVQEPIANLRCHEGLTLFGCYCQLCGTHAEGPSLAAVLRAAPGLRSLILIGRSWEDVTSRVPTVAFDCSPFALPALIYLHDRVSAGLVMAATVENVVIFEGVYLTFWHKTPPGENREAARFLASLPPLPAVEGLVLDVIEAYQFYAENHLDTLVTSFIAVKFPSLTHLTISHGDSINITHLVDFLACKDLSHLCIRFGQVTRVQLATLCSHLRHLKVVELVACEFSENEGECFERQLAVCNIHIRVIVSL